MSERPPLAPSLILALVALCVAGCGRSQPSPDPSLTATAKPPAATPGTPAPTELNPPREIRGRILGLDTVTIGSWSAGILEFRPTDPEVLIVASTKPGPDGRFSFVFDRYRWDIPYAVIAFQDANGNGIVDSGEDFIGGEVTLADYRGKNLFLIARAGTFVGDRPLDLEEAEFLLDVRAR